MDTRRRKSWIIGGGLVVGAVVAFSVAMWRYEELVHDVWWPLIAQRPLSEAQSAELARCEPVGWWAWLRVMEQDLDHGCGERWGAEALGRVARPAGRRRWLQERLTASQGPVRGRWRAAAALEATGVTPTVAAGWLVLEPGMPPATLAALDEDGGWDDVLGPRYAAMAAARRALGGGDLDGADLGALRLLALAGGAEASLARSAAEAWVGLEPGAVGSDRPPHQLPPSWSRVVHRAARCERDCAATTVALVETLLADPSGLDQPAEHDDVAGDDDLGLLKHLVGTAAERQAVAWLLAGDLAWAEQSVAPAALLVSVVHQPGPVPRGVVAQAYTGRHPPLQGALWLAELADRLGLHHEVRSDGRSLWTQLGEVQVAHCGSAGRKGATVPLDHVVAWALEERGEHGRAARLAGWAPPSPGDGAVALGRSLWAPAGPRVAPPCRA